MQVALGLRSLAIKLAVFVVLAGVFAWFVGGSIFPGSQVVNGPAVEWAGVAWHPQVTGNGRHSAPVEWRIYRTDANGTAQAESFGVPSPWRQVHGPYLDNDGLSWKIESDANGTSDWWLVSIDRSGTVTVKKAPEHPDIVGLTLEVLTPVP